MPRYIPVCYTASLARPLRRRARKIRAPVLDALRTKKPCVVARFFFLGWYVRLVMMVTNVHYKRYLGNPTHLRHQNSGLLRLKQSPRLFQLAMTHTSCVCRTPKALLLRIIASISEAIQGLYYRVLFKI